MTMAGRQEAETKLEAIEQGLLTGNGRATREVARQLVQLALEAFSREKDLEVGVDHLNLLIQQRDELHEQFIVQLRKEHSATVRSLSNM